MRAHHLLFPSALVAVAVLGACNLVFGINPGSLTGSGGSAGAGTTSTGAPCASPGVATCDHAVLQVCDGTGRAQSTMCSAVAACDAPNLRCNDAAPGGRLAVGQARACVIDDSRNLQCWGENHGLVWTDTRRMLPTAEAVPMLTNVRQISIGSAQRAAEGAGAPVA